MADATEASPRLAPISEQTSTSTDSPAKLTELITAANLQYSLKNYDAAAEIYSKAAELQDEVNGEMDSKNADLLYLYGRCLYRVAISKSDVLGGKVAGEDKSKKKKSKQNGGASGASKDDLLAEEVVEAVVEEKDHKKPPAQEPTVEDKPYFSITGDENWDTSSDEEEDGDGQAEAEEEEDDFATAFGVLEMARVLLSRQLASVSNIIAKSDSNGAQPPEPQSAQSEALDRGKGKAPTQETPDIFQVKEKLADTHDLLAEISLENERFDDAVIDARASLALKQELYPKENSLVCEAHYKLSLALEFASVTAIREAQESGTQTPANAKADARMDEAKRKEAASQMAAAIESLRLRIHKEEQELERKKEKGAPWESRRKSIKECKEMLEEMEQRYHDLVSPTLATDLNEAFKDPAAGILGSILGETPAQQKVRIEEATVKANDITGLVRHKKKSDAATPATRSTANGSAASSSMKRKIDNLEPADELDDIGKKPKVDA